MKNVTGAAIASIIGLTLGTALAIHNGHDLFRTICGQLQGVLAMWVVLKFVIK